MDDKVDIHMPLFIGDYLADTMDLTTEEHGAYLLIMMELWRRRGVTSSDHAKLARIARLPLPRWKAAWGTLGRFFAIDGEELRQKRLTKELEKAMAFRQAASEAGKRSAAARIAKHGSAKPPARWPSERPSEPNQNDLRTTLGTESERPSEIIRTESERTSEPNQNSLSLPSEEEGVCVAPARPRDPLWPAGDWLKHFGRAWAHRYKTLAYGQTSDGKACGNLADFLGSMDPAARENAQARAGKMFAEFLRDESPEAVKARHPFAFFVGRFGGLLVDPVRTKADTDSRCNLHRQPGTFRQLPRGGPVTGCPTCKENAAARGTRESEPTPATLPTLKPPPEWTAEQKAEMAEAVRNATAPPVRAAGGSK